MLSSNKDVIAATRAMVATYMTGYDSSHDMYHVDRVTNMALKIAKDCIDNQFCENVDLDLVHLAALCHDVGDRKYYKGKETGGSLVKSFLAEQGYAKAELVARIVDHVGFSKELGWDDDQDEQSEIEWRNGCIELHAVQDADKLDAIGAFGVLRCAAFSGAKNRPLFVPDQKPIKDINQEEYLKEDTANNSAITHFHEKLFRLKSMMRTEKGKALAIERDQFMQIFVKQVNAEFNMIK